MDDEQLENTNCELCWLLSIKLGLLVALVVVPRPSWALTLLVKRDSVFCWSTFLFKIGVLVIEGCEDDVCQDRIPTWECGPPLFIQPKKNMIISTCGCGKDDSQW